MTEVAGIVATCKLEPQADTMLHHFIAELADLLGAPKAVSWNTATSTRSS